MADQSQASNRTSLLAVGIVVGLLLPTAVTWGYFVLANEFSENVQQVTYAITKTVQFLFPVVWAWVVLKQPRQWPAQPQRGIAVGIAFGLLVTVAGWLLFDALLREHPSFVGATDQIRAKVAGLGLDTLPKYIALGAFYSLVHSLLEEYYWRWFVFNQLRRLAPLSVAIVVSAIGFMLHHVLVLGTFFDWAFWPTALLSTAVAAGGAFWAWLYARSGSLVGPWISHLLVDAGIFFIGYQLLVPLSQL